MEPTDMATFNPQSLEKSAPANCGDGTGHRGWRIGWSPSLVPSSARVTSALSWTKCAPTLSTSRTGSRRLVTQWLRGKKGILTETAPKKWLIVIAPYCTLLLIVTWDIRFDEHNHWVFKIHEQDKLYQTTMMIMIVCSIPGIDSVQPPHGVNEVVELDISIQYYVWHVYVHPKSPNC